MSPTALTLSDAPPGVAAPARTATVGIIEDDPVLRAAFTDLVAGVPGLAVVGTAATATDGVALLDRHPDVVLLDLALPDGSGLDVIAHARRTGSTAKMIVITVFADVRSVVGAIEQGADGYLLKDADAAQLAHAIRTVLDGGAPISPAVAGHILARVRADRGQFCDQHPTSDLHRDAAHQPICALTEKETLVLEDLARGCSFKEVARRHAISLHTVGDHVKAIYRKLSVNSRGEAVFKAVTSGLIALER